MYLFIVHLYSQWDLTSKNPDLLNTIYPNMKTTLVQTSYIVGEEANNNFRRMQKIIAIPEFKKKFISIYSFRVNPHSWKPISLTKRFAEVEISSLSKDHLEHGKVIVFMEELGQKAALPFNYYQLRRVVLIKNSFELGKIYVHILGEFILNTHSSFSFKVILVEKQGYLKHAAIKWENYRSILKAFRIREDI